MRARPALPPPTAEERELARAAAAALRGAIADPSTRGEASTGHISRSRPRGHAWFTTWSNLPGFMRSIDRDGRHYTHTCLRGWTYARHEIRAEMIPDLDALAERGERPT